MKRTIKIGDRDVEMLANAASPYIFRTLFGQDFIKESQNQDPDVHLMEKMGFVMAIQASKQPEELKKVTEEDFFLWLSQFDDPYAIPRALEEIVNYYNEQDLSTSSAKKEEG